MERIIPLKPAKHHCTMIGWEASKHSAMEWVMRPPADTAKNRRAFSLRAMTPVACFPLSLIQAQVSLLQCILHVLLHPSMQNIIHYSSIVPPVDASTVTHLQKSPQMSFSPSFFAVSTGSFYVEVLLDVRASFSDIFLRGCEMEKR